MNTRNLKIIAATSLAIFAGAAVAEGESQIDYTNMYSSTSRAEVLADTMSFERQNDDLAQEAFGSVDVPSAMMSDTTRAEVLAEARHFRIDSSSPSYLPANESYNGFPTLDRNLMIDLGRAE